MRGGGCSLKWSIDDIQFLVRAVDTEGQTLFSATAPAAVDEHGSVVPIRFGEAPSPPSDAPSPPSDTPAEAPDSSPDDAGFYPFELDGAKVSLFVQRVTASGLPRMACFSISTLHVASERLTAFVLGKSATKDEDAVVFCNAEEIKLRSSFQPYDDSAVVGDNPNDMQLETMMESGYGTSQGTYEKLRTIATFSVTSGPTTPLAMLQLMTAREPGPFGTAHPTLLKAAYLHEAFAGFEWY